VPLLHAILPPAHSLHHPQEEKNSAQQPPVIFVIVSICVFLSLVFFLVFVPFFFGAVPLPAAAFRCHTGPTALPLHF